MQQVMDKKRPLGSTGISLDVIGLGTWGLGGVYYGKVPFNSGVEAVRAYIDGGGTHIDTAYSYHQSEDIVGAAIKPYARENLIITSKTYAGCMDPSRLSDIRTECEISLRDLGTDYLDVYMIHGTPFDEDHLNRLIDEFEKLKAAGKIRHIGCSIRGPMVNDETRDTAILAARTGRIEVMQLNYSIARQKHREVFAEAGRCGVGLVCRWVYESGMLAGKYPIGHEFVWPDTRNRYRPAERDAILQIGQELKSMLPEGYKNPVEIAAMFALAEPEVGGIILGGNTADQVRRNLSLTNLPPLPAPLLKKLKENYTALNDRYNPTGEFEHVDSPRRPLEE